MIKLIGLFIMLFGWWRLSKGKPALIITGIGIGLLTL